MLNGATRGDNCIRIESCQIRRNPDSCDQAALWIFLSPFAHYRAARSEAAYTKRLRWPARESIVDTLASVRPALNPVITDGELAGS